MQQDIISVAADVHQRRVAADNDSVTMMMMLPIIRHSLRDVAEIT